MSTDRPLDVSRGMLEALLLHVGGLEQGASAPTSDSNQLRKAPARAAKLDVPGFLARSGLAVGREQTYQGGRKWIFTACPMDASHEVDRAAYIIQFPSGVAVAGCHHARCSEWGVHELLGRYDPQGVVGPGPPSGRYAMQPSEAGQPQAIAEGSRVRAHDWNNIGTVQSVDRAGSRAQVLFVSKEGSSVVKTFPLAELTVLPSSARSEVNQRTPSSPWKS